jgi:hypothetical protein
VPGLLLPEFGEETAIAQPELCEALTAADVRAQWCGAAAVTGREPRINPGCAINGTAAGALPLLMRRG